MGRQVPVMPYRGSGRKPALKPAARATSSAAPAARRPSGSARDRTVEDPPQDPTRAGRQISGRMLALAGVLIVLVLLFAPTVRSWANQQQQIASLEKDIATKKSTVAELEKERKGWDDPDYVRQEARKKLYFVMPGETGYVVIDDAGKAAAEKTAKAETVGGGKVVAPDKEKSWYVGLWESVRRAGTESAGAATTTPSDPTPDNP